MSHIQKSFLSIFNIHNWNIGIKLNVLIDLILLVSFTLITVVGFILFEKRFEDVTYHRIEQITFQKKQILEKEYNSFLKDSKKVFSEDLLYSIEGLKTAYKDYPYERSESFSLDTLNSSKILLKDYYESEILGSIEWNKPELNDVFPQRDIEIVLQKTYLVDNKWPLGEKDKLINSNTGSSYASYHQIIQTEFRSFARKHKINNIYLIDDQTGDIIYNLNKNIAFGTNLFNGKFSTSELGRIFQESLASTGTEGKLFFSDFTNFSAELNRPVAYIAQTLLLYNDKVAVAVIELSPDFFQSIIVDTWLEQNKESVEINLIGEDMKFRMNEIEQYTQTQEYFNKLKSKGVRNTKLLKAAQLNGGACVLGLNGSVNSDYSKLSVLSTDYNEKIFLLAIPLNFQGVNWSIVGFTHASNQEKFTTITRFKLFLVYILLLVLAAFTLRGVVRSMVNRLHKLSNAFISLSKGEETKSLEIVQRDELGETMDVFNVLNKRLGSVNEIAMQLSEGNFNTEFKAASENDSLAAVINKLSVVLKQDKSKLDLREAEDKKIKWLNEGVAEFNDILRKSNNDIKELAFIIIENMVRYLNANQGGVFLVEGDSNASRNIQLVAAFAYDRRKYNEKTIEIGEGLLGNCYLERKSIHLNKIPEDYIELTSGLGSAIPSALYIVPLMMDEKILGFIELASLNKFETHHVEFIEKLSENIAGTLATVKLNTRTTELLEESKRRANEIAQQEEEMRQNMEEMQATQEELARLREEDERRTQKLQDQIGNTSDMLQTLINTIPGEVIVKDSNSVVVLANEKACERYETSIDAVKGMSDGELLDKTIVESEHALDAAVIKNGEYIGYRTESVAGSLVEYIIEKRSFYLKSKNETGIITIWKKAEKGDA